MPQTDSSLINQIPEALDLPTHSIFTGAPHLVARGTDVVVLSELPRFRALWSPSEHHHNCLKTCSQWTDFDKLATPAKKQFRDSGSRPATLTSHECAQRTVEHALSLTSTINQPTTATRAAPEPPTRRFRRQNAHSSPPNANLHGFVAGLVRGRHGRPLSPTAGPPKAKKTVNTRDPAANSC